MDYVPAAQGGDQLTDLAILVMFCENAQIEYNVIDLKWFNGALVPIINPMHNENCKQVTYFNNSDGAGTLIRGARTSGGTLLDKAQDAANLPEDATTLALLF